eukprot:6192106-Pleurochrysis_carterae.AAC.2
MALCLRNDGVLFEDATLQIGIKMEFNGHQGRMAVYFGNKCPAPLMSFGTQLSPCAALAIQASPVAATLNPRSQQQLLLNIECLDAFGEGPQLAVRAARTWRERTRLRANAHAVCARRRAHAACASVRAQTHEV